MGIFDFFKRKNGRITKKKDDLSIDTDINSAINRINEWAEGKEDKEMDEYMENLNNPNYEKSPFITGITTSSQNKKYSITVCDRQKYYIIYEDRIRKFKEKLERPNNGNIANNGTFTIEDWLDDSKKCCGIFYAFNSQNEILLKYEVNANILNSSLSNDGKYACMQTCNSENKDDCNKLFFFDLENNKLIWKKTMPSGWADSYNIDSVSNTLTLNYKNASVDYDFNGNIKNLNKWSKQRLNILEPYQLKSIAEDLIKSHTDEIDIYEDEILELLTVSESKQVSNYQLAQCYRWLGEAFLGSNNKNKCITYFEKALSLYPRIGVKKLYTKLKSE